VRSWAVAHHKMVAFVVASIVSVPGVTAAAAPVAEEFEYDNMAFFFFRLVTLRIDFRVRILGRGVERLARALVRL